MAASPGQEPSDPGTPSAAAATGGCAAVRDAQVGSATVHYQGQDDPITLSGASWTNVAGDYVELTACGTGDLDGDGANEALAALEFTPFEGTGRFWSLAAWHVSGDAPVFVAVKDLDDGTPVQSITISGGVATVVWLTRGPSDPTAAVTIRRTSTFKLAGTTLTEVSHTDEPYTAS